MIRYWPLALGLAATILLPLDARGQDTNIFLPVDTVEHHLMYLPIQIQNSEDSRFEGDRTQRVLLSFPDSTLILVKWARSAPGGEAFNNQPRYEIAAYELQQLFLDPHEYVVPPTVGRMFPLAWYRQFDSGADATFGGIPAVLVVLQYWLANVTADGVYDRGRLRSDTAYARHLGNLNLFTYLARHRDANEGNVLISQDSASPRLFAVDNGIAFASEESNRGDDWEHLRVDRLPGATIDRLRNLEMDDLERALGVVAQFELRNGEWVAVEPTENLDPGRGIRRTDRILQLGLTTREIRGVQARMRRVLDLVDAGRLAVF